MSKARLVVLLFLFGCNGCNYGLQRTSAPPAGAPPDQVALSGASILIGAGDIAECGDTGDEQTSRMVDSVLRVNATVGVETVVFTLGDHAYPQATDRQLRRCLTPSWGDSRKLIMRNVRPSIGNHDYEVDRGAPYYRYFGARAGPVMKGYYSYSLGDWHVVVLNSELAIDGSEAERKEQVDWLAKDLQDNRRDCTVAYFHVPLFSSSWRQGYPAMRELWTLLYERDVDLVLNGHDHHYERFRPQNPAGAVDSVKGIEQIIVGTGGASLRGFRDRFGWRVGRPAPNSLVRIQGHYGVLLVALGKDEYRTAFLATEGGVWDHSGRKCH